MREIKTILDIESPNDIKEISDSNLDKLVDEAREMIINVSKSNGGHWGANTSVLETTVGMMKVLDLEKDILIFDIGHNSNAYKLFTGRAKRFSGHRNVDGLKAFQDIFESKYDHINQGNAGTAPSNALGMAAASNDPTQHFVTVIGDSTFGNGTVYEYLNHAAHIAHPTILVVNDNSASIGPVIGTIQGWENNKNKNMDQKLPEFASVFDFEYIGPFDGHNWRLVSEKMEEAKKLNSKGKSVILHFKTVKGNGIEGHEKDLGGAKMHAIGRPNRSPKWDSFVSQYIVDLMRSHDNIDFVTAAMLYPLMMDKALGDKLIKNVAPNDYKIQKRVYNVGIAEGHAASFTAGLALAGRLPILTLHSAFARRAYDHILHDIAIVNSHAIILVPESGTIENGNTHHGFFDFQMFNAMINTTILFPSNPEEMKIALDIAVAGKGLYVIKYPKYITKYEQNQKIGSAVDLNKLRTTPTWFKYKAENQSKKTKIAVISYGQMLARSRSIILEEGLNIDLINAFYQKPIDVKLLSEVMNSYDKIILIEDTLSHLGIDSSIAHYANMSKIEKWMYPENENVTFGKEDTVRAKYDLDHESLRRRLSEVNKKFNK